MNNPTTLAERLFNSAKGSYPAEGAALIITGAVRGTLPDKLAPAIIDHPDVGRAFIDWEHAVGISGPFSSGERRIINLAASLASPHEINVGDVLSGLDDTNARIVLHGLAHCLRVHP